MRLLAALALFFLLAAGTHYRYPAEVVRVYDGDTIWVDLSLGLGVWLRNQPLRLYGIDTPELRGPERPEGLEARDALREWLSDCDLTVQTIEDRKGKFGRWLAVLWCGDANLNERLVETGHAERASY